MSENEAKSPLVSILVPTYNAAPYLEELCQSILAQTYPHFEALFLDDGSSDNSLAILDSYRKDSRFRVLSWKPNRGMSPTTRALLEQMKGAYWCFPGADDVLYSEFVAKRVESLNSHPEAAIVHGPAENIDVSSALRKNDSPRLALPSKMEGGPALSILLQHNIVRGPSVMVRSEVTRRILPFFPTHWKYAPDWHLWILHAATGASLLWDERCLTKYRVHDQSLTRLPHHQAARRAEIRLVPLCALNAAAQFSPAAAGLWAEWRAVLYRLWLHRAFQLRRQGILQEDWVNLAGAAYYGGDCARMSLVRELCSHAGGIYLAAARERRALKRQTFLVSGLAQMDNPVFR